MCAWFVDEGFPPSNSNVCNHRKHELHERNDRATRHSVSHKLDHPSNQQEKAHTHHNIFDKCSIKQGNEPSNNLTKGTVQAVGRKPCRHDNRHTSQPEPSPAMHRSRAESTQHDRGERGHDYVLCKRSGQDKPRGVGKARVGSWAAETGNKISDQHHEHVK